MPNDKLRELYGFEPPKDKGLNCTEVAEGVMKGSVRAVFQLGGNLVRSLPDHTQLVPAWRKLRLTVQVLTKLNRSCLEHGEISYILPCLGRIEIDEQATGPQAVSMEDSTACIHGSRGYAKPASEHLRSEPWIIAEIAKAVLPPNQMWIGTGGLPTTPASATRSRRPIRTCSAISTRACSSLADSIARSPRSTANGRPRPARPTS
jgi:anaerobic selenocysteine-containing dehydrogenase